MTVQERIDSKLVIKRFMTGWKEGTVEELEADYPFMQGYINRINWYENNTRVAIFKKIDENEYSIYMYSHKYEYRITLNPRYMGASASCRAKEPLEDWTRGQDLPDGEPNEDTLKRILYAILSQELIHFDDGHKPPMKYKELCGEKPVVNDDVRNNVEFTC